MIVRIRDKESGSDDVLIHLSNVLEVLESAGQQLSWSVMWLWAVAKPDAGIDVGAMEQQSAAANSGYRMTWNELVEFSDACVQVIEGIFAGCKEPERLTRYANDAEFYSRYDLMIEVFDSSEYLVATEDEEIVRHLLSSFAEASVVEAP